MTFSHWISHHAERTPERVAIRFEDQTLSYGDLSCRCEQIAGALHAAGVAGGDRVAWLGLNSPDMIATLFACARLGAIFMPLNWRLAAAEHQWMLQQCMPAALFVDAEFVPASAAEGIVPSGTRCVARDAVAPSAVAPSGWSRWPDFVASVADLPAAQPPAAEPRAPLLLCYTSGSTGRPKGVLLSADALAANADASVDMHGLTPQDRVLTTLPLFHVGGLNIQTTPALRAGCTVTLHARFDADATFDAIEHERITLTVLVPAQLDALIAHPRWASADLSSLRMVSTGSTIVPQRLIESVHARGVPLVLVWGATETAPIAACLHADEAHAKAGSTGRAAAGCQLRIVGADGRDAPTGASGEILVRGRTLMNGYWHDEAASARALSSGWYHSGDSGHLDAEGFLTVDGRLKDMIISGGENVSPAEVEGVLLANPDVAEAAVVGRADDRWGEVVVAVVVPRAGATLQREQLLAQFEGRLARFKHPKDVLVVSALPRTALGKLRKEDVRQLVAAAAAMPTLGEKFA